MRCWTQSTNSLRGTPGPPLRLLPPTHPWAIGEADKRSRQPRSRQPPAADRNPRPANRGLMAAFNANAPASLASPTPCRPTTVVSRSLAARWTPLRCSPPSVGLRRGPTPHRRGATLLVRPLLLDSCSPTTYFGSLMEFASAV